VVYLPSDSGTQHTHTKHIVLRLFWILSGTTQVSRYQKGKIRKVKPIWIYWSKRQSVAVASAESYIMCTPFDLQQGFPCRRHEFTSSPIVHIQSSSLHGAVKAGSCSGIEKRALPPPCFLSFNFQSSRSQAATFMLLPPVLM